jgi:hypothetical protein
MATVKLSQTYLYAGKHYGPGEVEIADAEAAKALTAREAALRPPAPAPPTGSVAPVPAPRRSRRKGA